MRNDDIRGRLKVENITEVQESETEVVWTHEETRPRICRKKDSGDGTTWEKKEGKTEAEMDGLCQSRHELSGQQKIKSMTELAGDEKPLV